VSRFCKYLLLFLLFLFLPAGLSRGAELEWPLKGEISLSSLFCDYRPFHYHSGLDLRTGGKVGWRVYAPGDGYLHRTRTSFWGYGKALYMRLDDGRILVFGHLSRFSPGIEERVFQEQIGNRSYRTDLFYEVGEVPIKKGQLIAYTGQSGSGGPHLHFEMRDENNNPINPLGNGFEVGDHLSPRFLNLAVRDLSVGALDQDTGSCRIIPAYYERTQARYELVEVPAVSGRFGLEVNVVDRVYTERDYYGVHALEFFLDDSLIYSERFDTISFETTRYQELYKDFGLRRRLSDPGADLDYHTYYNLYDLVFEPFTGVLDADAGGALFPGKHKARIRVGDFNGNSSDLDFELLIDRPPQVVNLDLRYRGGGLFSARALVDAGDFAVWLVRFEVKRKEEWEYLGSLRGEGESAVYRIDWTEDSTSALQIRACALDIWEARSPYVAATLTPDSLFARTLSDTISENIIRLHNDDHNRYTPLIGPAGGSYRSEDGMVSIEFEPGCLYFDIGPWHKTEESAPPAQGKLVSPSYEFFPQGVPFMKKATLTYDLGWYDGERSKLGIYEVVAEGDFEFLGNQLNEETKTISAKIDYFAAFALLEDSDPPRLSRLYPSSGSSLTDRTPRIFAQLKDDLSGIVSEDDIEVTIDGIWVPAEYDYEAEHLFYQVRSPLKYGKHTLIVSATDACGNETVRRSVFTIAESE
jgi:hypothetical protein